MSEPARQGGRRAGFGLEEGVDPEAVGRAGGAAALTLVPGQVEPAEEAAEATFHAVSESDSGGAPRFVHVHFEVEQNYSGWRLDRYLQQKIPRLSRARIQEIIRRSVRCETRRLKPATAVTPGLRFYLIKQVEDEAEVETSGPVQVLHDDAYMLVLDKPAGLAVHPSARYHHHTITRWLSENARSEEGLRPDLAHRLDRETSGVLACGRGPANTRALKEAFAQRQAEKSYLAVCEGRVAADAQTITARMRLTEKVKVFMEVHPEGLSALTEVRVLRRGRFRDGSGEATLVECRPQTGRQHQIRVHLKSIGHPIVGDKIYGDSLETFLRFCDGQQTEEDRRRLRLPRQALHAWTLALPHPETGEMRRFQAPLAPDLRAFCEEEIEWEGEEALEL